MAWQLQDAKQRFSELVRLAEQAGPQIVTRHGTEVAVVISAEEYRRLYDEPDFKAFLRSFPPVDELEISRDTRPAPEIDL